jgi:putative ABC transport system permease protein
MNVIQSFFVALRGLAANKLRSALTVLGIVIGVGAVITLISVGEGVQDFVTGQFESVGANVIYVFARGGGTFGLISERRDQPVRNLTLKDADALADPLNVPGAKAVVPVVEGAVVVVADNRYALTTVVGTTAAYPRAKSHYPAAGTFVGEQDLAQSLRSVVLGQTVAQRVFPDQPYPVGRTVELNGVRFQVIGVLEKKPKTAEGDPNDVVVVPLTTARRRLFPNLSQQGDYAVDVIYVQARAKEQLQTTKEQVARVLRGRRRGNFGGEDDFYVVAQGEFLKVLDEITGILTIFLGSIAGISLLVGGIGIMNIMLVSVTERTREIGLRKAVGAKRRDILIQFLVEAVVLSLIGGACGILLGGVGAHIISIIARNMGQGFQALLSLKAVLIATLFSAGVGLFFGIYPARRASRLNPIEALRYE